MVVGSQTELLLFFVIVHFANGAESAGVSVVVFVIPGCVKLDDFVLKHGSLRQRVAV
jgi:hypothetical protein